MKINALLLLVMCCYLWSPRIRAEPAQVNLNTASLSELTQLPGIGPAKAEAIVAFRERHPFTSPQELSEVRGIGPKLLERLTPLITVASQNSEEKQPIKPLPGK